MVAYNVVYVVLIVMLFDSRPAGNVGCTGQEQSAAWSNLSNAVYEGSNVCLVFVTSS